MQSHTDDLLSKNDEDLFTKGGCHVFAVCLAETFGYPLRLLRDTSVAEPGGVVHVYCLLAPDIMIDFMGPRSEREYLRNMCYDFPPYCAETVNRRRIEELSVGGFGRGGLYAEAGFVATSRSRALAAINASRSKYAKVQSAATSITRTALSTLCWLLVLTGAVVGCSDDRKVVLSDRTGSRTLVYPIGSGFVPQARVPEDIQVLVDSFALAMSDAKKDNDFLTMKTLQKAWRERDYRNLERTIVEFRLGQLERGAK